MRNEGMRRNERCGDVITGVILAVQLMRSLCIVCPYVVMVGSSFFCNEKTDQRPAGNNGHRGNTVEEGKR
jgi:hypothetical protein